MVLKRLLREGREEGSEALAKRRHLASPIFRGLDSRGLQESVHCLEPLIRKWVREAVECAVSPLMRSTYPQVEFPRSRTLHLQFHSILAPKLFTGSKVVSEDKSRIKVVLYDSISKRIVSSGPQSSVKVSIVVLDGDFEPDDQEDWTKTAFDTKIVRNREGKRPLVTGDLTVALQAGVGYLGDIVFTDNSSWIRSGNFRLGAKVTNSNEIRIREARSNAFKVKDHRGEFYQKHHPPSLEDEVWRLEKIAKEGASHKKLIDTGIYTVRDFLRFYVIDQHALRAILRNISNKAWGRIIAHAAECTLDDTIYSYRTASGTVLFFNSIYKLAGVTFDGYTYLSVSSLNIYQKMMVEDLKQHAYKNLHDWVLVSEHPIDPAADAITNSNLGLKDVNCLEQVELGAETSMDDQSAIPSTYKTEEEHDTGHFKLGEGSLTMQDFNPSFLDSFRVSDSSGGFYIGWQHSLASVGHNMDPQLSTDDLPIDKSFDVKLSAWPGNELYFDPSSHGLTPFSANSGTLIPRIGKPKTNWCKVLAVVKWRILVRRNVAARNWKYYGYV